MKHHIIFDHSGSMAEYGKSFLLVNLLRYIRQEVKNNNQRCNIYGLSNYLNEIQQDDINEDINIPDVIGKGLEIEVLLTFLEKNSEDKVLFLTDGYFDITPTQLHEFLQHSNLIVLALGADAHYKNLQRIKCPLFMAVDISAAIDVLLLPSLPNSPPLNCIQLKGIEVENDDEW